MGWWRQCFPSMTRTTERSLRRRTAESITAAEWDARAHTTANFMCTSTVCMCGLIVCISANLLQTRSAVCSICLLVNAIVKIAGASNETNTLRE